MSGPHIEPDVLAVEIVRAASRFIGLREVRPNAGWDKPATPGPDTALVRDLLMMMRPSPWEEGWAYCAAFAEGVVAHALANAGASSDQIRRWHRRMTPHCVTSAGNFKQVGLLSREAAIGAVWLARHGSTSNGHAGLVTAISPTTMATIEANTSLDATTPAKEREGDWITTRLRDPATNGKLRTLGFISPADIVRLVSS